MVTPFSKYQNIEDIKPDLESEEVVVYPICENILFVARKSLDPFEDDIIAYDKNLATIVGLFHKQMQLFSEFYTSYKDGKFHICLILQRVIYEAFIKMQYLIKYGEDTQEEYRLYSYKARKKFYDEQKDSNNGYVDVRNGKFLQDLTDDGFELSNLTRPHKSFGGKNVEQLIDEFEDKALYSSLYGMASDSIHSDWGEIRQIYLNKTPDKKYAVMIGDMPSGHYRSLIPVAVMLIDSCKHYVNWEQGYEPNKVFIPLLDELRRVCELIMASVFTDYHDNPNKFMYE